MSDTRHLIVQQIPHLRRYARALVGDNSQADDLVQDCLERAWSRMDLWTNGTNLRAWLFTILHNLHSNTARKQRNTPTLMRLDGASNGLPVRPAQEDRLKIDAVWRSFYRLPEAQRAALLLIAVEDLSYEDAAEVLDIPIGTLMSRVHRAREKLRHLMAEAERIDGGKDQ